jgi:hypothetical protein
MHDDQFTAVGPSHHTSGFKKTAFSTSNPSDFEYGVNVQGGRCGVYGESAHPDSIRESTVEGVGIHGFGENFGVVGNGSRGIAGVYGHANRSRTGVLGAAMRGGTGVIGASVENLGNPLGTFRSIPDPADGSGIGVLGTSGRGTGVQGSSADGSGGDFSSIAGAGVIGKSEEGIGVHAVSNSGRGGVFQSGRNVAQINLVPLQQNTAEPELPKQGEIGDLLLIVNSVTVAQTVIQEKCSLWLCVPRPGRLSANAFWQEVQLGDPVEGTI